eukprot:10116415-Prorocentrum_lima.AAC.1
MWVRVVVAIATREASSRKLGKMRLTTSTVITAWIRVGGITPSSASRCVWRWWITTWAPRRARNCSVEVLPDVVGGRVSGSSSTVAIISRIRGS